MGVDVGESKAIGVLGAVGTHGIPQAAGLPDYGQGAVAHGDHLRQAAGLGDAGHEEEVRAAIDGGGEGARVEDVGRETAGILGLRVAEGLLKIPVAGAQDHHLHIHGHDVMDGRGHQLKALVLDQTGDAGDDGDIGVLPQADGLLEGGLTGSLAGEVVRGEVSGQAVIVGGIIQRGVDAVQDTAQLVAVVGNDALQTVGVEGILELAGIGGGDGGDIVGGVDGPLHQVHVPMVGQHMLVEVAGVETEQILQQLLAVAALVLDVVDGKDRLGPIELGHTGALLQQIDGSQGGLPVIGVDHIGVPVQVGGGLHHGTGEEGETLGVVIVAVETGALEVVLVIHEIIGHAVPLELKDAAIGRAPGQDHVEIEEIGHLVAPLLADSLVEGEDDAHIMAGRGQRLGKTARHIGQAACFNKRGDLRGSKENVHMGQRLLSHSSTAHSEQWEFHNGWRLLLCPV